MEKEWQFIFLTSRVNPGSHIIEKSQHLVDSGIDWQKLLNISVKHGVAPVISINLKCLRGVPEDVRDKFSSIYKNTAISNLLKLSEINRIIESFYDKGVETMPLKGAFASDFYFKDIGAYPSGDIDLLVRMENIDASIDQLMQSGYDLLDKDFENNKKYFFDEQYHIAFTDGKYFLELHWKLFFRFFSADPGFWWFESRTVNLGGKHYHYLSVEKEILYLAFRLHSKGYFQLKFYLLLAVVINANKNHIEWGKLFQYADDLRFRTVLSASLLFVNKSMGAHIPEVYFSKQTFKIKILSSYSLWLLFRGEDPNPVLKLPLIFMRDDFSGAVMVLFKRIFPPMAEIKKRYRLSSGIKPFVFYVLNPFILIFNRHK